MSDCTCTNCIFIDGGRRYCYDCEKYTNMFSQEEIQRKIEELEEATSRQPQGGFYGEINDMSRPFSIKYNWKDFDNTSDLTSYQKHRIVTRYRRAVEDAIQGTIDQSVEDRAERRVELDAHKDTTNPFDLDIGGQG